MARIVDDDGHCCKRTLAFVMDTTMRPPSARTSLNDTDAPASSYVNGTTMTHEQYAGALINAVWVQLTRLCMSRLDSNRIVSVVPPDDIGTTQFDVSVEQRQRLMAIGVRACADYLDGLTSGDGEDHHHRTTTAPGNGAIASV